jgi:opacity protein-like surface antigen
MRLISTSLRHLLAATLLLPLVAGGAKAEEATPAQPSSDVKGFYASLGVGAAWPQNVTGNTSVLGVNVDGNYSLGGGFAAEVGAGYDFGVVRTELTYLYNHATLNSLNASAVGQSITASISDGGVNTNSVLASAYVDIPTNSRWVPYVGGGLGYTNVSWGSYSASAAGITVSQASGSQGVFGYQGKVGVSYLASKSTDVFVEATYQGTAGFTVDSVNYDPLSSWGARLGARYRF